MTNPITAYAAINPEGEIQPRSVKPTEAEAWRSLSCEDQKALAERIAGNIGYELTPEPPHPDSPHASEAAERGADAEAVRRIIRRHMTVHPADESLGGIDRAAAEIVNALRPAPPEAVAWRKPEIAQDDGEILVTAFTTDNRKIIAFSVRQEKVIVCESTVDEPSDTQTIAHNQFATAPSPEREPDAGRVRELEAKVAALADELIYGGGLVNRGPDRGLVVVEKADRSDPHYRLCAAVDELRAAQAFSQPGGK